MRGRNKMRLERFQITDFRSVEDSGWIETQNITALIGANESGKTNLLLALWKLNPAHEGEVDLLEDAPRTKLSEIRSIGQKPVFVRAQFGLDSAEIAHVARLTSVGSDLISRVIASRDLSGVRTLEFPDAPSVRSVGRSRLSGLIESARTEIMALSEAKASEVELKRSILFALDACLKPTEGASSIKSTDVQASATQLQAVDLVGAAAKSAIKPRFERLLEDLSGLLTELQAPPPSKVSGVEDYIWSRIPSFVYYSNYGNLDSEIYLPHVIENLKRKDLGAKEQARARTLKVLFKFVKLQPEEILDRKSVV